MPLNEFRFGFPQFFELIRQPQFGHSRPFVSKLAWTGLPSTLQRK